MNIFLNKEYVFAVGTANFEAEVLRSKQPVLAAFWATWSQPCQVLGSVLNDIMNACTRSMKFVQINVDHHPDLSLWYGIESIPTLLYFVDGVVRGRIVGTASKATIIAELHLDTQNSDTTSPIAKPCQKERTQQKVN